MSSLKEILDRLLSWWTDLQLSTRIGVVLASGVAVAALIGVGIWSSRPQYTTLVNQLDPQDTAELVSKLEANGIDYKINFAASAILVPKTQSNRARMLVGNAAAGGGSVSDWDDSILGDPGLNQYKMLRHREQSLARSIQRMAGISEATVHIARPDQTPFIQDQRPTTASVVVEFQPAAMPTRETAAAIVALVAGSVEGLHPDGVSIMDTRGRMLSSAGGGIDADISAQFEFRRRLETDLATKAELMLSRMLGERRAIVRVSADIDFTRTQRTETIYDPESKVPKMELVKSTSKTGASTTVGGAVGIRSLGVRGGTPSAPATQNETTEDSTTDYEVGSSENTVTEAPGRILRLTIAVMADLGVEPQPSESSATPAEAAAAPAVSQAQVEAIVKQATGFDEQRGDEIEVLVTKLAGFESEDIEFTQSQKWELYNKVIRSSSLGLASLVALMLGLLTIYRLRPITIPSAAKKGGDRGLAMSEFSDRFRENPDVVKAVVSAWLSESDTESDESTTRRAA